MSCKKTDLTTELIAHVLLIVTRTKSINSRRKQILISPCAINFAWFKRSADKIVLTLL